MPPSLQTPSVPSSPDINFEDELGIELEGALRELGHEAFRPGQREAIDALFARGRVLLVAPTGGGKSLTYQLPAAHLPGTTLVVSPLIALMADQVAALEQRGIPATYFASTVEPEELRRRTSAAARGAYKLVYAAPERLMSDGFRGLLRSLACPLIAIDEAHCISEWGHDFRPEYMQLGGLLQDLPDARVLACTATATPVVRDEILERLGLDANTPQIVQGFARPNLSLRAEEVRSKRERCQWVDNALAEALREPSSGAGTAIIYAPTRKSTEEEAARLAALGWSAAAYHAGQAPEQRNTTQSAFIKGELEIVVATNAFGMGIDRADVRAVVHLAPPGSVESYYQEVGRAGRDGKNALGLLLIGASDMALRRHLIESDVGGRVPNPAVVQHKWNLFLELMRYAEGGSCRHDTILRYFDDEAETLAGCGHCDVCRRFAAGDSGGDGIDREETTLIVRKALSAIARVHNRYGLTAGVALLRGNDDPRLQREGLDRTKTFGILQEHSDEWLTRLLRRCVTAGWVDFVGGDRPLVVLTEEGAGVMRSERPVRLLLPPLKSNRPAALRAAGGRPRGSARARHAEFEEALDERGAALFEALRAHRLEVARAESVPPYVVASDRTLREIAQVRPQTRPDLLLVHGIGPAKADRYGDELLRVVREQP